MANLFDACMLGGISAKNRFVRSATHEAMADDKGHLTDRLLKVYEDLSAGGVGTIITGFAFVLEDEQPSAKMMGIYSDSFVDEYKKLTDMVHANNSKIVMQIVYGGPQTGYEPEGRTIWGPSAVADKSSGVVPAEMSHADIDTLVEAFAQAALRVKNAGFDGVQIHAAHGFLLSKFLTPFYNRRKDEYGGDIENRARIIFRIYRRIRELVGQEFPIWVKIHCDDLMPEGEGLTFQDSILVCARLAGMGINAIEISGGNSSGGPEVSPARPGIKTPEQESYFRQKASTISEFVKTDIVLVGGNRSIAVMDEILNSSRIKGFSLSRPLLCESDLINKWQKDPAYLPKCIYCNQCWAGEANVCIFNRMSPEDE